ncbi:MAG: hypothetical protein K8Q97_04280 [Candidatus Andersenbacteria bacterium]|nr:hypothetical protein [Candidatus Andersenbacteria bacterium]
MEYEPQEENKVSGFVERMKESPRTVSAIIIVVIVIAAIYAFSGNNQKQVAIETATPTPEASTQPTASTSPIAKDGKVTGGATAAVTPIAPIDKNTLMDQSKALPEEKKTDSAYIETAVKGDSLTTLSRKAATRYLASNDAGYQVTNEHRIYIEDYVRKHLAKQPVTVGSQETISFELIKQAVESAKNLNDKQLHNLTKYTHVLNT